MTDVSPLLFEFAEPNVFLAFLLHHGLQGELNPKAASREFKIPPPSITYAHKPNVLRNAAALLRMIDDEDASVSKYDLSLLCDSFTNIQGDHEPLPSLTFIALALKTFTFFSQVKAKKGVLDLTIPPRYFQDEIESTQSKKLKEVDIQKICQCLNTGQLNVGSKVKVFRLELMQWQIGTIVDRQDMCISVGFIDRDHKVDDDDDFDDDDDDFDMGLGLFDSTYENQKDSKESDKPTEKKKVVENIRVLNLLSQNEYNMIDWASLTKTTENTNRITHEELECFFQMWLHYELRDPILFVKHTEYCREITNLFTSVQKKQPLVVASYGNVLSRFAGPWIVSLLLTSYTSIHQDEQHANLFLLYCTTPKYRSAMTFWVRMVFDRDYEIDIVDRCLHSGLLLLSFLDDEDETRYLFLRDANQAPLKRWYSMEIYKELGILDEEKDPIQVDPQISHLGLLSSVFEKLNKTVQNKTVQKPEMVNWKFVLTTLKSLFDDTKKQFMVQQKLHLDMLHKEQEQLTKQVEKYVVLNRFIVNVLKDLILPLIAYDGNGSSGIILSEKAVSTARRVIKMFADHDGTVFESAFTPLKMLWLPVLQHIIKIDEFIIPEYGRQLPVVFASAVSQLNINMTFPKEMISWICKLLIEC